MQDFISKESETSVFIEAKAVALIYCLIKKNDTFHLSEMRKQELHYPPPLCFAMQNIGEVSRSDGGVKEISLAGETYQNIIFHPYVFIRQNVECDVT